MALNNPPQSICTTHCKNLSDKYGNESLMAGTLFAIRNVDSTKCQPTESRFHQMPTHGKSISPNADPRNVDFTKRRPRECRFHQTPTHGMSIPPNADPRKVDSTKKTCTVFTASSKVRLLLLLSILYMVSFYKSRFLWRRCFVE